MRRARPWRGSFQEEPVLGASCFNERGPADTLAMSRMNFLISLAPLLTTTAAHTLLGKHVPRSQVKDLMGPMLSWGQSIDRAFWP